MYNLLKINRLMVSICISMVFSLTVIHNLHAGEQNNHKIRIVITGDSTVQTYGTESPVRGWGQYIGKFFSRDVEVINLAKSGRSTKTFIDEGLWEKALEEKADYIFIQFGHNDSHEKGRPESTDAETDYRDNLRKYIDDTLKRDSVPVLITPMHRRLFLKTGEPTEELLPYANAVKSVAKERYVLCVDLHTSSGNVLAKLGDEGSADLYCSPDDRTHFSEKGARLMAQLITEELSKTAPELKRYLNGTNRVLRHVVLFKFKDSSTSEQIKMVEDAFRALPGKIDVIHDFEWGIDVSVENKSQGFTHCFFVTFLSEEDRNTYLPHPAHKEFGSILHPHLEKVLVLDYWARE